jgi:hypothetical protein
MADFVQSSDSKNAVRELTSPIPDVATFNSIVQSVITDNPFECVAYMTAGENHAYCVRIDHKDIQNWNCAETARTAF